MIQSSVRATEASAASRVTILVDSLNFPKPAAVQRRGVTFPFVKCNCETGIQDAPRLVVAPARLVPLVYSNREEFEKFRSYFYRATQRCGGVYSKRFIYDGLDPRMVGNLPLNP